jgi:hypothetical protein
MKPLRILPLILLAAFGLRAEVLLNETFTYADGPITTVAPVWASHSGTAGQVDIASGKVNITSAESEDVNVHFAARTDGLLFASFVVNFTARPSASGAYFFHFKDDGTGANSTFRARVFALSQGAATDKFRLGIANAAGSANATIATDLDLNTDYHVVVRFDLVSGNSTLWLAPVSEDTVNDRADATDIAATLGPSGPNGMNAVGLRQASGEGTLTMDDLKVGTSFTDVTEGGSTTKNPPSISTVAKLNTPAGVAVGPASFTVNDGETSPDLLTVTPASDTPALIPNASITIGGSGMDRTVTVTPAAGQQGTAVITLTVKDGDGNTSYSTFKVVVGAPAVTGLADALTPVGKPVVVPFTATDTENDTLSFSVSSTNADLLPAGAIQLGGSGSARTITLTPAADVAGIDLVTLVTTDGFSSVTNTFNFTASKQLGLLFDEPFNYPDGTLLTATGNWDAHSGTNDGPVTVTGGKAFLVTTGKEDVHYIFDQPTFKIGGGIVLYAKFVANFSKASASSNGSYFMHFYGTGSGTFRGRVFAGTGGVAAAGSFRLGIANNATTPSVFFPQDYPTGQDLTVVVRYNVGTGITTLWVNPDNENSPSVTATDAPFPADIPGFALRQDSSFGSLSLDDLKLGTAFADVLTSTVPTSYALAFEAVTGGSLKIKVPTAALLGGYVLETTGSLDGAWTTVETNGTEGDQSIYSTVPTGNAFFRLRK